MGCRWRDRLRYNLRRVTELNTPSLVNPWLSLPPEPPYVLAEDAPAIKAFNERAPIARRYDLSLFPEPFFGSISSPVLLLALNPGWSPLDAGIHAEPSFAKQSLRSLALKLAPYPFLHLQPSLSTPGSIWWQRITRALINEVGFEAVAKNLSCVQFFPYHSPTFGSARLSVPSQQFGFQLVRNAVRRNAEIVVMRSRRLWFAAVPELSQYSRVHFIKNPRNPSLSPNNLTGFKEIATCIRADI